MTIENACKEIGITNRTYYKVCKRLNKPSVTNIKEVRLQFLNT